MQCKLKAKCPVKDNPPELHPCWKSDCEGFVHVPCCNLLLDRFSISQEERPQPEDQIDDEPHIVFCAKTCYLKWIAEKKKKLKAAQKAQSDGEGKKRKVPWEEDGSLSTLMEWITTEGNYSAHAGSNGNASGKSKSQCHKEIAILIKSKNPESQREAKDVENEIVSLERQFRLASDWANNTGQGVENPGDFEAAILKRCPLFKELEPNMGERHDAKPLCANEEDSDTENVPVEEEEEVGNGTTIEQSTTATPAKLVAATKVNKGNTPSTLSGGSSGNSVGSKRLTAASVNAAKKKGKKEVDDLVCSLLGQEGDNNEDFHSLRVREVTAKEQEAQARIMEASEVSEKAKKETALLAIDETVKLLRARKQMIDEGICSEDDIDKCLPMPPPKKWCAAVAIVP